MDLYKDDMVKLSTTINGSDLDKLYKNIIDRKSAYNSWKADTTSRSHIALDFDKETKTSEAIIDKISREDIGCRIFQ